MTEAELMQLLAAITPPDETARAAAHTHWASLAKPLGGLGALETLLEDAAALTGTAQFDFSNRTVARQMHRQLIIGKCQIKTFRDNLIRNMFQ